MTLSQSRNTFSDDAITGSGYAYTGGGEFAVNDNMTSLDDRFVGNTLPGPNNNAGIEGAGLSALSGGNCTAAAAPISSATNLIATGNQVGAPTGSGTRDAVEGAGVYVGCEQGGNGYTMTLNDSTITDNSVAGSGTGAVAGIDGETADTLTMNNPIIAGNTGGIDVGGFGPTDGANVTSTDSDVCAEGSTTNPFAGTGNICAAPALTDPGTGDVNETSASPTIDKGSNALVPPGVSTDAYGQPRIVGTSSCTAIVDMGAAEDQQAASGCTTPTPTPNPTPTPTPNPTPNPTPTPTPTKPDTTKVTGVTTVPNGIKLTLTCTGTADTSCTDQLQLTANETVQGSKTVSVAAKSKKAKKRRVTLKLTSQSYKLAAGKHRTITVTLRGKAKTLLTRFKHFKATLLVTEKSGSKTKTVTKRTVTLKAPKPKPKKKK